MSGVGQRGDKKIQPFLKAAKKHGARIVMSSHIKVYDGDELVATFSQGHRASVGPADLARERKIWKERGWL